VAITAETPVRFLKGVGASRAKTLEEYGLTTAGDLLWFFPFRYEDRRHPTHIADLGHHLDEAVLIRGKVISAHSRLSPVKRMKIFEAVLEEVGTVNGTYVNDMRIPTGVPVTLHNGDLLKIGLISMKAVFD